MNEQQIKLLANELAKNLKMPEDLNQLSRVLKKITVEATLNAELTDHLGYKKNQTRITGMDEQIITLYTKGLGNQEIVDSFKEFYDADVLPSLISRVTDSVKERIIEWRNEPLNTVYSIVYLDCIVVKVRQDGRIIRIW
ncbi:IS256 family transposase IS1414 [Lonepinella sp. MS14434]